MAPLDVETSPSAFLPFFPRYCNRDSQPYFFSLGGGDTYVRIYSTAFVGVVRYSPWAGHIPHMGCSRILVILRVIAVAYTGFLELGFNTVSLFEGLIRFVH